MKNSGMMSVMGCDVAGMSSRHFGVWQTPRLETLAPHAPARGIGGCPHVRGHSSTVKPCSCAPLMVARLCRARACSWRTSGRPWGTRGGRLCRPSSGVHGAGVSDEVRSRCRAVPQAAMNEGRTRCRSEPRNRGRSCGAGVVARVPQGGVARVRHGGDELHGGVAHAPHDGSGRSSARRRGGSSTRRR